MTLTDRLAKLYTSAVHDVMHGRGHSNCVLPPGLHAVNPAHTVAGEVFTIDGHFQEGQPTNETLRGWAEVLSKAPAGKVIVCQPNTMEVALMGELSAATLQKKGVLGYIADGGTRDVPLLAEMDFPVFSRFATPKDIAGRWKAKSMGEPIVIGTVTIHTGDYVLADRDGVVILPAAMAEEIIAETEAKADTENQMREALLAGMDPLDAFDKFGTF